MIFLRRAGSQTFVRNRRQDPVRHDLGTHPLDRQSLAEGKVFRSAENGAATLCKPHQQH